MKKKRLLRVLLIHGTWSSGRRWREDQSPFWSNLKSRLAQRYEAIEIQPVEWPGLNRWRTRERAVLDVKDRLAALSQGDGAQADYLLIGHSYGGSVATEAARARMEADPDFEPLGVICLNTPFLKQEPRPSAAFLKVWMAACLLMVIGLVIAHGWFAPLAQAADAIAPTLLGLRLDAPLVGGASIVLGVMLLTAIQRNRLLLREQQARQKAERWALPPAWGRQPRVLCLTSADDEAIAGLSILEGLTNLAQLLLHPVAMLLVLGAGAGATFLAPETAFCPREPRCWFTGAVGTGTWLMLWLGIALAASVLAGIMVSWVFGRSWSHVLEATASRVLVSYVPLQPAKATFRAIVDADVPWWSIKLFHSRIDDSGEAVEAALNWLIPIFVVQQEMLEAPPADIRPFRGGNR